MDDSENQLQNDPESPVIDTLTVSTKFHSFIELKNALAGLLPKGEFLSILCER